MNPGRVFAEVFESHEFRSSDIDFSVFLNISLSISFNVR